MEVIKFVALSLSGALISTVALALVARPLVPAIRHLVYPHQEATRSYSVPATR
jgi:hypothetical protein